MKPVLEGLLFLVGEEGIDIKTISEILETTEEETKKILQE